MSPFVTGMLIGWVTALAVFAGVALVAYRLILRLQARAKHAERLAELGTLTGGLAHEIKNPLSTVQLNLQLLLEDLADLERDPQRFQRPLPLPANGRLVSRLRTAERETARLREILDDFLRYAGRIELERRPVELNRLCEDLVDFFHPQAQLAKVNLRLRRHPTDVVVEADERLLKQALLNLLLNAVQAMPDGGEVIIGVTRADGREAVIDVIDTGPGIPPEARERIFDAYYSTKRGGTGLGLAMARRIAEEHGGRVSLASEVGKGSDFALHLPMK